MGIAIKESICNKATYTTEYINERLMAMRFEISGHRGAINFIAAYAPTEVAKGEAKQAFWDNLDDLMKRIPSKECVYVMIDANARTGQRMEESLQEEGVLGAYGRDELNDNGHLLLTFAADNRLAITNTFFSTRKGGISHTYNGVAGNRASDFKRIDYILTRQAHRGRVRNVVVHPQPAPPARADSDHNMVVATVDIGVAASPTTAQCEPNRNSGGSVGSTCTSKQPGNMWSRGSYTTWENEHTNLPPPHQRPRGSSQQLSSKLHRPYFRQKHEYHTRRNGAKIQRRER